MKFIKNNRWILGLAIIIILIAGFLVFDFNKKKNKSSETINYQRLDNISYAIGKDYVEFRYVLDSPPEDDNNEIKTYSKKDFPKLWNNFDSLGEIMVKPIHSGDSQFYILANVSPDHGGISYTYGIVVDIFNNNVLYETNEIVNKSGFSKMGVSPKGYLEVSTYYKQHYKSEGGLFWGYLLNDYLIYDKSQGKFIVENVKHKEEIAKTLDEVKNAGKDESISNEEYSAINDAYENILNGKEESLLNLKLNN